MPRFEKPCFQMDKQRIDNNVESQIFEFQYQQEFTYLTETMRVDKSIINGNRISMLFFWHTIFFHANKFQCIFDRIAFLVHVWMNITKEYETPVSKMTENSPSTFF